MFPEGQGARRQAKLLRRQPLRQPLPQGPMVELHGMAACIALGFAPGLLGGPTALQRRFPQPLIQ